MLKKYTEPWDEIRSVTNTLGDYDEKHIKIKFNSASKECHICHYWYL